MKLISHRGNYNGINVERENKPSYIDTTISMGYDVEVDIRYINGDFYLGHDTPDTKISENWILNRSKNLWLHCKDLYTAQVFKKINSNLMYFCHTDDDFVLTSTNHIWVHNLDLKLDDSCIIPLLDEKSIYNYNNYNLVYGVCTDFINICKSKGM